MQQPTWKRISFLAITLLVFYNFVVFNQRLYNPHSTTTSFSHRAIIDHVVVVGSSSESLVRQKDSSNGSFVPMDDNVQREVNKTKSSSSCPSKPLHLVRRHRHRDAYSHIMEFCSLMQLQKQQQQERHDNNNKADSFRGATIDVSNYYNTLPFTASSLWRRHFNTILNASIHPFDVDHQIHLNWTRHLLLALTPQILQQAIRSHPTTSSSPSADPTKESAWVNLLRKVSKRYQYVHYNNNNSNYSEYNETNTAAFSSSLPPPPPVQVLVFGGSVTYGRDCHDIPPIIKEYFSSKQQQQSTSSSANNTNNNTTTTPSIPIQDRDCSWVFRLQHGFDTILGPGVVQIHNMAAGGTDTLCSLPMLLYQLYRQPPEPGVWANAAEGDARDRRRLQHLMEHGPDVIINAYSTNDNSFEPSMDCQKKFPNMTQIQFLKCFEDHSHDLTQLFTTFATTSTRTAAHSTCISRHDHSKHGKPHNQGRRRQNRQPIVLYMDDYVGGFWKNLPEELIRHGVIQDEHKYNNFPHVGHVSAMSALSRIFDWAAPPLSMYSPRYLLSTGKFHKSGHFGMPGHMARTWIMAYALLQWTVDSCQDVGWLSRRTTKPLRRNTGSDTTRTTDSELHSDETTKQPPLNLESTRSQHRNLNSTTTPVAQSPHSSLEPGSSSSWLDSLIVLPPPLQSQLRLANITLEWHGNNLQQEEYGQNRSCSYDYNNFNPSSTTTQTSSSQHQMFPSEEDHPHSTFSNPCSFAFVAGPAGTHKYPQELRAYLQRHGMKLQPPPRDGGSWNVQVDYKHGIANNLGLVAFNNNLQHSGNNSDRTSLATSILRVANLTRPIQVITMHYLKSYGDTWMNSLGQFDLYIRRRHYANEQNNSSIENTAANTTTPIAVAEQEKLASSWQLSGWHNHTTSVSHVFQIDIGVEHAAHVGDEVELHLQLVSGTYFKISSLLMCSR